MIIKEFFQFSRGFLAALATSALLVHAAGVSAEGVTPPPKPNGAVKVKIEPGEPLGKDGYTKKVKPPSKPPKSKSAKTK